MMCGCDCCKNNGNPTCFDVASLDADGPYWAWQCKCDCYHCITRLVQGALWRGATGGLQTSLPASDDSAEPVLPTSVASAGEGYGAHNAALTPWDMRVLVEMLQSARALVESEDFDGFALGRATGRAEAWDAAAAVELLHDPFPVFPQGPVVYRHHVLAAIAAMWGAE